MTPAPLELFQVTTRITDTSYVGWDPKQDAYDTMDQWAFDSVTFYAHPELLPHPNGSGRKRNRWVMHICERQKEDAQKKRIVHVLPEFTDDGFVKGLIVHLGPEDMPAAPPGIIKEFMIPEWEFKLSEEEEITCLYHCDFYNLLRERSEQDRYLRDLLPFDTTQFLVNIAEMISGMGVIDSDDVGTAKDITEDAWLSADQVLQDN